MPNAEGIGFVDYVLWGDDGLPLAVVEAKKTTVEPAVGQQQAKLYADCLEQMTGRRPVIFYTNGYQTLAVGRRRRLPAARRCEGFFTKDELELMVQRRTSRLPLADARDRQGDRRAALPAPGHPGDRRGVHRPSSATRCW